jgi:hypothetical protein
MLALDFIVLTLVVSWLVWDNLNEISRITLTNEDQFKGVVLILLRYMVYGVLALICLATIIGLFLILF